MSTCILIPTQEINMPNHVSNVLTVTGDTEKIEKCLSSLRTEQKDEREEWVDYLDFNKIIPMPEEFNFEPHTGVISAAKFAMRGGFKFIGNRLIPKEPIQALGDGGSIQDITRSLELTNMIDERNGPLTFSDKDFDHFIRALQCKKKAWRVLLVQLENKELGYEVGSLQPRIIRSKYYLF